MKILNGLYAFFWNDPTDNNCNTYLISNKMNVLVDPGHDHHFGYVLNGLSEISLGIEDIDVVFVTHGHPDHIEAVSRFKDTSAIVMISEVEKGFIRELAVRYPGQPDIVDLEPDILLREGCFKAGDMNFQVVHTPGHSPGSVCLQWRDRNVLFTGDLVFNQGIGRTDLPGGDGHTLRESIERISELEIDYLLPGHGEPILGRNNIKNNFDDIERTWFAYL